jgi:predicted metal-dependent hydrolase
MDSQQLGLFAEEPPVQIIRSKRRKKTIQASQRNGVLTIVVPENISKREERHWTKEMLEDIRRTRRTTDSELSQAAYVLAERYRLPIPRIIRWIPNQRSRWAFCDIDKQEIGICENVKNFPQWVGDYVIVHELAHLVEPAHNSEFWKMVHRFKKAERARGYLEAKAEDTHADL